MDNCKVINQFLMGRREGFLVSFTLLFVRVRNWNRYFSTQIVLNCIQYWWGGELIRFVQTGKIIGERGIKKELFPVRPHQTCIGGCEFKKMNYLLVFAAFRLSSNILSVYSYKRSTRKFCFYTEPVVYKDFLNNVDKIISQNIIYIR